ncbi:MAG: UPF0158 family protein [Myxococcota bacterium]|jgi:hypothetical protein
MKRKLKIDWDTVVAEFSFKSESDSALLDLETGEVRYLYESGWDGETIDEIGEDELEKNPGRYAAMEPPDSGESFRWMERFAEGVKDNEVRGSLFRALQGRRPFRGFKDTLIGYPDTQKEWYVFEERCIHEYIADWANSLDVEITNPPAWLAESMAT